MNRSFLATLVVVLGVQLLGAQNPNVQITNVPAGLTLTISNAAGLNQLDTSTFRLYVDGIDLTAAYTMFVNSGSPLVMLSGSSTSLTIVVASNLTSYAFAARVCTLTGSCASAGNLPPLVLTIASMSGAPGTPAMPIATADPIVIGFSAQVTTASLDPLHNFIVRNLNVTNTSFPQGIIVPGSIVPITPGATADTTYVFTPASFYGPGISPTQGFDIDVRIGSFGAPPAAVPPILGVPTGPSGTQLALANSLSRTMRTTPCSGCQTPSTVAEDFATSGQRDGTFVPTFSTQQARWNDPSAPSQLAGRLTSGSPAGTPPVGLGTRVQFTVDPQPPTMSPAGLFAPFDASAASSGGQCGAGGCNLGVNPNGGSHIMHLYESADFGNTEDSLEQIEWSSPSSVTAATVYPNYKIWCGVSSVAAPLSGGAFQGLSAVFDQNYNLAPYQTGIPTQTFCGSPNARKVPCGGPTPYAVPLQTTNFYPFPILNPCFDLSTSTGASGAGVNLLFEQDIDQGNQAPNFNRFRATNFTPVRRLIDKPLALVPSNICPFNLGGGFDVYRVRLTFVGIVGQARSLWYDTGTANPNYLSFIVTPPVSSQPAGTQSTWILEGTDTSNPGPGTSGAAATYIDAAGTVFPNVLSSTIAQLRYFRFRIEFRGNNVANTTPAYNSVMMAYSF